MGKRKKITLEYLKQAISTIAQDAGVHASEVTPGQLKSHDDRLTPWKLREFGGIAGLRKYFPKTSKDLAAIKTQKELQSYINKLEKELGEKINYEKKLLNTVYSAIKTLNPKKQKITKKRIISSNTKMTMELMLSDIHYGKKTQNFDLDICRQRMQKLTAVFIEEMKAKEKQGYVVEKFIIALIGDIIESYTMHGIESALSCEFGNARQIQESIDSLFTDVILPLAKIGIPISIPAVCGNHDRTEFKKTYNDPGENHMTWIIYHALERYCKLSNLNNVTFDIPKGSYTTLKIYRDIVLYEHFDELKATTKIAIKALINKRSDQTGKRITMARGGHWHEYVCYDRGLGIVNESACGQDSYAKVKGYNSKAGQTINFYVDDPEMPNDFLYSYPVSLS